MDYSICKDGKDLVDQLRPHASALDRCPTNGSLLMQMYVMPGWASCTPPPRESCQQAIPRCHHARAPHMLHPKYRGEKLTMEQQQDVSTWLASRDPGFITSFTSFQAKAAPFPSSYFSVEAISISPHTWWQGTAVCGVDPAFDDLLQRLTTSPASSASIERVGCSVLYIQFHTERYQELAGCPKSKQACLLLPYVAWNQGLGLVNYETSCQICANNPEIKLSLRFIFVCRNSCILGSISIYKFLTHLYRHNT